jgi:outer membrane lipoprotein LolB
MNWNCGFLIGLLVLLSACAELPERGASEYQLGQMLYLQKQSQWSFMGRLALVGEKDSLSASIRWKHDEFLDEIELAGPLDQGRMKISVKPEEVIIDDGDKVAFYAGSADDVVAGLLGVDMPVTALRFWVLGVYDPDLGYVDQSAGFYQGKWSVKYSELQKVDGRTLPKKMTAESDKARIKLIVDEWNLM